MIRTLLYLLALLLFLLAEVQDGTLGRCITDDECEGAYLTYLHRGT